MNHPSKQTYQNDLAFQSLFYLPMILAYLIGFVAQEGFFIGLLIQFFVGVSQVLSGAYHAARYKDKEHIRYFMIAIAYLAFLFLGGIFGEQMGFVGEGMVLIILFI